MINEIILGDCLDVMKDIPDGSVDMILCDLPYGTTACKWDSVIPFDDLWEQYRRIKTPKAVVCLFGQEPFSTMLRMSNIKWFKYDWIWNKVKPGAFATAKYAPLKQHEVISVFYDNAGSYNPQMIKRDVVKKSKIYSSSDSALVRYNDGVERTYREKYPKTILEFSNANQKGKVHPTQKPVELFEYLIKTYTNEGNVVLDNCIGSGTTAIACVNTNRNFIGIEKNEEYYNKAVERLNGVMVA